MQFRPMQFRQLSSSLVLLVSVLLGVASSAIAQASPPSKPAAPPSSSSSATTQEDVPEEVLRTEIITDARSPIDGKPLSASEYAALQAEIEQANQPTPQVAPKVRETVGILRLRKFIKTFFPFAPIK